MSTNPETFNPMEGGYQGDKYDCGDTYDSNFPSEDLEVAQRDTNSPSQRNETDECDHQYREHMTAPLGVSCVKCGHFVGAWET